MSTIGKVFAVLNILVALAFLYFATPVVKRYIDLQKDVHAIEHGGQDSAGMTHRSHAEIEKKTIELDAMRVQRIRELGRIRDEVSRVRHERTMRVDELVKETSFYQNLLESETYLVKQWQEVVAALRQQVEKRKEEKSDLETRLADLQQSRNERQQSVESLMAQWTKAKEDLSATLAALQSNYEKLDKLAASFATEAGEANVAASAKESRE